MARFAINRNQLILMIVMTLCVINIILVLHNNSSSKEVFQYTPEPTLLPTKQSNHSNDSSEQRSNLTVNIEPNITLMLTNIFRRYLDHICDADYSVECTELLQSMINISISLRFDQEEIELLAQRIQYLQSPNHITKPVLFIHIPKTGGTGFGRWLEKGSNKRTKHLWIPDNMKEHMFDDEHYPKNSRMNRKNGIPDVVYGHAAYGFDTLFLNPKQIQTLSTNSSDIMWKARMNFSYITVLRHPFTRVPSHYYYQRKGKKDENHKWAMDRTLFEWISYFEEASNCLVQFISGCHHRAWYTKKYKKLFDTKLNPWPRREKNVSPDMFIGMNVSYDQYKIARNHLLNMPWVGLTEYMTESVEQLKVFWNSGGKYKKNNVNGAKPKGKIAHKDMEKLREYNQYDIELWDIGYVLFLQQKLVVTKKKKRTF